MPVAITKDKWFAGASILIALLVILLAVLIAYPGVFRHMRTAPERGGVATTTIQQTQYVVKLKNLSYENYYLKNGNLYQTVPIEIVRNIEISSKEDTVGVGNMLNLSIIYEGTFNFNIYDASPFIANTIDVQYLGYYENGSKIMLVYNNRPNATQYFVINGTSELAPSGMAQNSAIGMNVRVKPTSLAANKTWVLCGGYFEAFANNTGWVNIFNNLTYQRENHSNSTIINMISSNCIKVYVHA
ncbi:MAG: hypothetical protein QXW10_04235 [Candidatus Micrarchaeaceae archaeon]